MSLCKACWNILRELLQEETLYRKYMTKGNKTMPELQEDCDELRLEIQERLAMVNKNARRYRRLNTIFLIAALLFGLSASAIAGDAAGEVNLLAAPIAQATTNKKPERLAKGWRNVCGVVATLTFIGTAATGLNRVLKITDHRSKAFVCLGTLDSLEAMLMLDSDVQSEAITKVRLELAQLLKTYPEYFR